MTTPGKPSNIDVDIPNNLITRSDAWNKYNIDINPRIHSSKSPTGDAANGITTDSQTGTFTFGSKGHVMNLNGAALCGDITVSGGDATGITSIKAERLINVLEYSVNTDSIKSITNAWMISEYERQFKGDQYINGNEQLYRRSITGTTTKSVPFIIPLGIYWDLFMEDFQFVSAGNLQLNFTFRDPKKCCALVASTGAEIVTVSNLRLNIVDLNLNSNVVNDLKNQIRSDGDSRIIRSSHVHRKNMIDGNVVSTISQAASSLDRLAYYYMANDDYATDITPIPITNIDYQIGNHELFTGGIRTAQQANTISLEAANQMSNPFVHMSSDWISAFKDNKVSVGLFQTALEPEDGKVTTGYNTSYNNTDMPFELSTNNNENGIFVIIAETSQILSTTGDGESFSTILTK